MRVLFVQPSLAPPGGGNGVAAWMLQALKDEHEVTLLTWGPLDLDGVNRFWGTSLRAGEFRARRVPAALQRLADALPLPVSLLRTAIILNVARRLVAHHDVPVTANNGADLGRPGVQYVHDLWNMFPAPRMQGRWYHPAPLLRLYSRLCQALARASLPGMRRNVTLVNSDWTGRRALQRYGLASRTVYPPATAPISTVPWEARESSFICVGRISPEKELDRVIDIVAAVRREIPGVGLRIVGTPGHRRYFGHIARRARAEGVALHLDVPRGELARLVGRQRYGIHGMQAEPFGMATAELVRAGCVTWVPDDGGQVEIVADGRLTYASVDDAVARILRVLRAPAEQAALRAHLAARGSLFSSERFMREIRAAVEDAAAGRLDRQPEPA